MLHFDTKYSIYNARGKNLDKDMQADKENIRKLLWNQYNSDVKAMEAVRNDNAPPHRSRFTRNLISQELKWKQLQHPIPHIYQILHHQLRLLAFNENVFTEQTIQK